MTKIKIALVVITLLVLISNLKSQDAIHSDYIQNNSNALMFHNIEALGINLTNTDIYKKDKQLNRWEYFWKSRVNSDGSFPSGIYLFKELQRFIDNNKSYEILSDYIWEELGPTAPAYDASDSFHSANGNGRLNCIAFHPIDSLTIFVGSASGGLWITRDFGATWNVVDLTDFLSIGIADIAVSKSNPDVIYAATGDAAHPFFRGFSIGLIKSTDMGLTWSLVEDEIPLSEKFFYTKIYVDNNNENSIVAATTSGIFKSEDSGKTKNWVLKDIFIRDLIFHPVDSNILYATSMDYYEDMLIYRSEDNGDNWTVIHRLDSVYRTKLAVTPAEPNSLYALNVNQINSDMRSFIKSTDMGDTWHTIIEDYNLVLNQGYFNLVLLVDPVNPDIIFAGGVYLHKNKKKGINKQDWIQLATPSSKIKVHVDFHDIQINPHNNYLFVANDGGIYYSKNHDSEWVNISKGLGIRQFYRLGLNHLHTSMIFGGSQDNGMVLKIDDNWHFVHSGDGMKAFFDYSKPEVFYSSVQNGNLIKGFWGGKAPIKQLSGFALNERKSWVTPFIMHPKDPNILYASAQNVWKSTNAGENWERISELGENATSRMTSIDVSKFNPNFILASNEQYIFLSTNAGIDWTVVYQSEQIINSIAFHPDNPDIFVAVFGGYNPERKVLKFSDGDIINLSTNLPNFSINDIIFDERNPETLYIATDAGVFVYDGTQWSIFGKNMPNVIVNELEINYGTGEFYAATFGRGLWKAKLFECDREEVIISISSDTTICYNDILSIKVQNPNSEYNYFWSNGEWGTEITTDNTAYYYVTAIKPSGCISSSKTHRVIRSPIPNVSFNIKNSLELCEGEYVEITALIDYKDAGEISYLWSDGSNRNTIKITEPGIYQLEVFFEKCENHYTSSTFDVIVHPAAKSPEILKTENKLSATLGYNSYIWWRDGVKLDFDYKQNEIPIEKEGSYYLEVYDTNWCRAVSNILPIEILGKDGDINIMPNPFENEIAIEFFLPKDEKYEIRLFDITGKEIYNYNEYSAKGLIYHIIKIHEYSSGNYILNVNSKSLNISKKLLNTK